MKDNEYNKNRINDVPVFDLALFASQIIESTREQVYIREQDRLMIIRPNRMYFVNKTAYFILKKMYDASYGSLDASGRFSVDLNRIISECVEKFKTDRGIISQDISNLLKTLSSVLNSQNSIPFVDMHPAPNLKLTGFGSHELYYPVLSEIAMTYACQLKCKFCYAGIGSGIKSRFTSRREMDIAQIKKVIDKICDEAYCPTISFTGGEPTLRFNDLTEAIRYAKLRKMRVNLITNGIVLADCAKALELSDAGLDSAQVSIEGAHPAVHDAITGAPGSFQKSIEAVKNLIKSKIHVHTNSTVTSENVESIYELPNLLSGLGLKYFSVNMVIKTGSANVNEALLIGYENIGGHIKKLSDIASDKNIKLVWYSPTPYCLFNPVEAGLGSKSCAAASGLLSVSPCGDVLPCSSFKDSLGNLLEKSFEQIWSTRSARYFRNKEFMPPVCAHCDIKEICQGGCPLYWDAKKDFKEIESCNEKPGGLFLKNAAWKFKRHICGRKFGF